MNFGGLKFCSMDLHLLVRRHFVRWFFRLLDVRRERERAVEFPCSRNESDKQMNSRSSLFSNGRPMFSKCAVSSALLWLVKYRRAETMSTLVTRRSIEQFTLSSNDATTGVCAPTANKTLARWEDLLLDEQISQRKTNRFVRNMPKTINERLASMSKKVAVNGSSSIASSFVRQFNHLFVAVCWSAVVCHRYVSRRARWTRLSTSNKSNGDWQRVTHKLRAELQQEREHSSCLHCLTNKDNWWWHL